MISQTGETPDLRQPPLPVRALAGLLAAAAAIGVGSAVAAVVAPAASPLLAVGSALIDLAPTPVKTAAVRALGTDDKPVLVGSIALVVALLALVIGAVGWRHRRLALVGIGLIGLVGAVIAALQGGALAAVPSLISLVAGVALLSLITRPVARDTAATVTSPAADDGADGEPSATLRTGRRSLLVGLSAAAVLAAAGGATTVLVTRSRAAVAAARDRLGLPRPSSPAPPLPAGVQVPGDTPFTTSIADFYRVDIALTTPQVPVEGWKLRIDGMVDRPLELSYDELLALPMIERDITLTCVSNEVGGPYVGTARWLGVPFGEIIRRVGVQAGVDQVYSYSSDSGYTCSTPYRAVSDGRDAMIVVGMNGQVLPAKNGFPARMLVPGLFGFVSATKWLERLEFTTYASRTAYWTERGWATDAPILLQSRIDVPASLGTITRDKPVLAGVAWAQHRGIAAVEVQIDDGPWQQATLADDGGIDLWRQWYLRFDGPAGRHTAQVRAISKTGERQPQTRTKVFPRGATGWHQIQFTVE
ncbi:DMSO/TMAO reductase YedYZ molybdopterin-dependent catalytic subunit [Friedmanniella endophytica]|uniref:DMSO/TMAO reductase YedYZ molybdopterin-dependent catalytic subunit n=1 Tax=Microlunatus kandeliicorticis TaxID=1759536 RepID=A0A7W3IQP2_9ACTN|nr:molybdopterin-dependent oxidoreductase [Microlunatus kandeliicorticis]MBA8793435.1 DMSO/TMAO reductase YedYZ molybdopterin-dependent catalytic subunit [Microlunatus kandeliicorticis]